MREPAGAAAGEDDPQGAPDEPTREPPGSGVARLGRREAVVGARLDTVEEGAEGVARGRAEEDEIGLRRRGRRRRAVGGGDEQLPVGLTCAEVAPQADACLVDQQDMGVLVLRALDRVGAGRRGVEDLDRPERGERVRERRRNRGERHAGVESPEGEQRRAGGRRGQAAARLELRRELARHCGGEAAVELHQLDEPVAAELEKRRVAHRLDGRGAGRAGEKT